MNILLQLFFSFFKVSCFTFGGAYAAIPLIRDAVHTYGWLTDDELTYMIAVSESTPGPIMVNLATYVGAAEAGFLGALVATVAVVLPAYLIILLATTILKNTIKHPNVQAVLKGLKPCVVGFILATGLTMSLNVCGEWKSAALLAFLIFAMWGYQKIRKKKLSPIALIILSAVLGMLIF